jgi:isoquinoline 1-oxidoreductase subunit alpha
MKLQSFFKQEFWMTKFVLNGQSTEINEDGDMPLLWAIRDVVGLTGTKFGCGQALCGACTVLIDGVPSRSCSTPISSVEGMNITTIEGMSGKVVEAVQAVWVEMDVPQCGYCQSGQVIAASALLTDNKKPSDADIDGAMAGNICRCATYPRIRNAIHEAAKRLEA